MVHVTTTQPPRRHESLMQKSSRKFQTPPHHPRPQVPSQPHYLKPTTSTWSPLDFASYMTSSPIEIGPEDTQTQKWIDNTNKVLPSTPYSHKSSMTVLPTRSSSLTNPVTKLSPYTVPSRPLPSLPPFDEQKTTLTMTNKNTPTINNDDHDTSSYNTVSIHPQLTCEPTEMSTKVDNDIESAMLHWKRTSTLTLSKVATCISNAGIEGKEDYDSFFTEDKELWSSASIFGDIEAIVKRPSMQENCQQIADQLWKKDESTVPVKEAAQFLGRSKLFNHTILQLYLEKFDFTLQHLEYAFRCFCSKLYFKAEAQEIDRILQAFAYRYWFCNKQSNLLYNTDIVYAIVYSMLLLNTDLHIVHGSSHHRMSRSEFCDNTMATIINNILAGEEQHNKSAWKHDMESYLKETYTSVKFQGILQTGPPSTDRVETAPAKESSGVTTTTKSLLQRMGSLKQTSPSSHRRKPNIDYNSGTSTKLEMLDKSHARQEHGPGLEGRVRYKTNNDNLRRRTTKSSTSSSSSSTSSGWHEGWLILHHDRGNLRLEKQQITSSRLIRSTNQVYSWEFDLGHSTAAREAPVHHKHYHDSSLATFHLVLGNGHWYEFECDDQDTVTKWIHHLQFAAAMATNIPFMRSPISSDLYGWEPNLTEQYDQLDSCTISTWEPPQHTTAPPMTSRISSSSTASSTSTSSTSSSFMTPPPSLSSHPFIYYTKANIINQHKGIQQYLATLGEEHQQHSIFFSLVSQIPTIYHTQKALIVTNWHEKNDYLIQEVDKYGLYGKVLEAPSSSGHSIDLSSLLAINSPIHSFDLFDEINHSLKHVSLE